MSNNCSDRKKIKIRENISDSEQEFDEEYYTSKIAKKKSTPKIKRVSMFTKDLGTYDISSSYFKNDLGRTDKDKIRKTIEDVMLHILK